MANTTFLDLPIATGLDGSEVVPIVQPPNASEGVSKRVTVGQIAALGNYSNVLMTAEAVFGNPTTGSVVGTSIVGLPYQSLGYTSTGQLAFGSINLASQTAVVSGGLGTASLTSGALLLGQGTSAVITLANATSGYVLVSTGTSGIPAWAASANAAQSGLSVLGVTGTADAVPAAIVGTANQVLVVNQAGTGLVFGSLNATAALTGIVSVLGGGTGTSALTAFGLVVGAGTASVAITTAGLSGSLLLSQGTAAKPLFVSSTGDVTYAASGAATIATAAVSYLKFQNVTGLSVVANASSAATVGAAVSGTADQVLRINSAGTGLAFGAINVAATGAVTGIVAVANGGSGTSELTAFGLVVGNGTSAAAIATAAATGLVLVAQGTGAAPRFGPLTLSAAGAVTGIVAIANGGTNATTAAQGIINLTGVALNTTGQAFTGGVVFTSFNLGTAAAATVTLVAGNPPLQRIIINGTATFVAPSSECEIDILVTIAAAAGAITFSGYSVGSNTGDAYATTNTQKFILMSRTINGSSTYAWKALQ